jgi:hypothetical protein
MPLAPDAPAGVLTVALRVAPPGTPAQAVKADRRTMMVAASANFVFIHLLQVSFTLYMQIGQMRIS